MRKEEILHAVSGTTAGARNLFPKGDQESFWIKVWQSPDLRETAEQIRAEGERLLVEPLQEPGFALFRQFADNGNRIPYEKVYFEKRKKLTTFFLLAMIKPHDDRFLQALYDTIWSVCNEYTWCLPAHLQGAPETDGELSFSVDSPGRLDRRTSIDLFAAETGFALSEILSLAHSRLPPLIRSRIEEEVVRRLFKPYLRQGPYDWETARHNWAAVCAGSIGSASLLLLDDAHTLSAILQKSLSAIDYFLDGFGADGACPEGVAYWNYGFGYFVYFADLLKNRTSGRIDLLQKPKVKAIAAFQQIGYLDGSLAVNFSDAPARVPVQPGLTHYLAKNFPNVEVPPKRVHASYMADPCGRFAPALRNLIWYDPQLAGKDWQPGDYFLPNAHWLVSRLQAERHHISFAAKAGHNDEPHNHNDIGQFILAADGEAFLCDLGSGEYTKQYFGAGRYAYACNGSHGHSVPIVEGQFQAEGKDSAARHVNAELTEAAAIFVMEMSAAYKVPNLTELWRTFVWQKQGRPKLILTDRFVFSSAPHRITERLIAKVKPEMDRMNSRVLLKGKNGLTLEIRFDPSELSPAITEQKYRDHDGVTVRYFVIDFAVLNPGKEVQVLLNFTFIQRGWQ